MLEEEEECPFRGVHAASLMKGVLYYGGTSKREDKSDKYLFLHPLSPLLRYIIRGVNSRFVDRTKTR
jgi:hypothetical protein